MSEQTSFEALRARKRADHLIDLRDEIASALTHGLGAVAALAGGAVLITLAAIYGEDFEAGNGDGGFSRLGPALPAKPDGELPHLLVH